MDGVYVPFEPRSDVWGFSNETLVPSVVNHLRVAKTPDDSATLPVGEHEQVLRGDVQHLGCRLNLFPH